MTEPYYTDDAVTLYHGDNREILKSLPSASLDACVTDPPYELGFMGRQWDSNGIAYDKWLWAEVWRVLKPGGHLLAFGGTRTWHRLAVAIEDAGFEVRDSIAWMYGSGFPKSLDVSKAMDKAAGAEREVVGRKHVTNASQGPGSGGLGRGAIVGGTVKAGLIDVTAPATDLARKWQGWGTALKPAFEPIVVARKPLQGTVAENVQRWGTGAINVDGCRIPSDDGFEKAWDKPVSTNIGAGEYVNTSTRQVIDLSGNKPTGGRWPANVILDESQAAELDRQSGVAAPKSERVGRKGGCNDNGTMTGYGDGDDVGRWPGDAGGGASRFFYTAKASTDERPRVDGVAHPTVKPLDLMQYLVRLVTPLGGTVLEPFAGSGTTLEACIVEGLKCVGIEITDEYLPLIMQRITKPIEVTLL